jgi:hypothetical protein
MRAARSRVEPSETRGRGVPDFAALNPGYGSPKCLIVLLKNRPQKKRSRANALL